MIHLKKILLLMLVICTLGYGSAWAYDGHAVEMNSDEVFHVDAVSIDTDAHFSAEQSPEKSPSAKVDCDHCAHISAHLLAIFSQSGYSCNISQSSDVLELSESFVSYIGSPDLRPPRV